MSNRDAFERILASLYDARLDDTRWQATSAPIDEACGLTGNGSWSVRARGTMSGLSSSDRDGRGTTAPYPAVRPRPAGAGPRGPPGSVRRGMSARWWISAKMPIIGFLHELVRCANDRRLVASRPGRLLNPGPHGGIRDVAKIPRQQVVDPVRRGDADVRRVRRRLGRKRPEFQQPPSECRGILGGIKTRDHLQRRQASAGGLRVACRGLREHKLRSDGNKPRGCPGFGRSVATPARLWYRSGVHEKRSSHR